MSPRPELINAERDFKAEVGDEHRIKRWSGLPFGYKPPMVGDNTRAMSR
jgi:hypothetical protein